MKHFLCTVVRRDLGVAATVSLPITPENVQKRGADLWDGAVVTLEDEAASREAVVKFFGRGWGRR